MNIRRTLKNNIHFISITEINTNKNIYHILGSIYLKYTPPN